MKPILNTLNISQSNKYVCELPFEEQINISGGNTAEDVGEAIGYAIGFTIGFLLVASPVLHPGFLKLLK